ncbi:ergothioneine biosynthesis protein EgtB [Arthrobacter sp. H14]|uniref:ergothioneine biosynthesis protein EgtB n=1 Tax=Arthrobacter sp. H14 TaxID=1312959 RepID=UPI0004798AA1|nr:ergothioneine biosynthesis protein EgtB [Arthrobacter sp. H14]
MTIAYVPGPDAAGAETLRSLIANGFERARNRVLSLSDFDDEELLKQHSPLMSPLVWDLAHVGSQEEQWLLHDVGRMEPLRCDIRRYYDAFEFPRSVRPSLPLLRPNESRQYIAEVRAKALNILEHSRLEGPPLEDRGFLFGMMIQHEQQHAETMLVTHQLRTGEPLLHGTGATSGTLPAPGSTTGNGAQGASVNESPTAARLAPEVLVPAGSFTMGTSLEPWAMDNERPAHQVDLPAFWIDAFPVTNAGFQEFIDDGGYRDSRWWTTEGWNHSNAAGLEAPKYWARDGNRCLRRRFGVVEPVPADEPVQHVCWYEADAFARWAGRRLPTETEWEKAARWDPQSGRSLRYPWGDADPGPEHANLGGAALRPSPAGSYPKGASPLGIQQLMGDVWEWVSSGFRPYPGFTVFPYEEYSAMFFGSGYKVLRGGSWAADPTACRGTFRNWDFPIRRQIFSGFRTARNA